MIQTRGFFGFFTGQWAVRSFGGKNREKSAAVFNLRYA